jgi:hypothetical protein
VPGFEPKILIISNMYYFAWFNILIISELRVGLNKKVKFFEKKVQKNLEVKKKVVPLQPV